MHQVYRPDTPHDTATFFEVLPYEMTSTVGWGRGLAKVDIGRHGRIKKPELCLHLLRMAPIQIPVSISFSIQMATLLFSATIIFVN